MVDGADLQIDAFHGAEGAFHFTQRFVVAHRIGRVHVHFGNTGADDMQAIKRRFGEDLILAHAAGEVLILDVEPRCYERQLSGRRIRHSNVSKWPGRCRK
jgi:hypothetical protein